MISRAPPTLGITLPLLTITRRKAFDLSSERPVAINGAPSPMQYPKDKIAPRTALDSWKAKA